MAYSALTTAETDVDSPITDALMTKIKANFEYLYSAVGSLEQLPVNGSFEIDADSSGIPDNWTQGLYTGGSAAYDTTTPFHGAKAYKFTRPATAGNGGGYLETGYLEISEYLSATIEWAMKGEATVKNKVTVRYFDADKVDLSADEDIYTSTANPTAWTKFLRFTIPPATARYMKVRFIGGYTDTAVAGDTYFDDVRININPITIPVEFTITTLESGPGAWGDLNNASIRLPKGFSRLVVPLALATGSDGAGTFDFGVYNSGAVDLDISALSGAQTIYVQVSKAVVAGVNQISARVRISTTYSTEIAAGSTTNYATAGKTDNWTLALRKSP